MTKRMIINSECFRGGKGYNLGPGSENKRDLASLQIKMRPIRAHDIAFEHRVLKCNDRHRHSVGHQRLLSRLYPYKKNPGKIHVNPGKM